MWKRRLPLHYYNENSLRSVIKLAYYIYRDYYLQFEELPGKEGYADVLKNFGGAILLVGINYDKHAPAGEKAYL